MDIAAPHHTTFQGLDEWLRTLSRDPLRYMRISCLVSGAVWLCLSVLFFLRVDWLVNLWPWPEVRMTFIFIAAVAAATAAPLFWMGITGELSAIAGAALNAAIADLGAGGYLLVQVINDDKTDFLGAAVAFLVLGVANAALAIWSHRQPVRDPRPMPRIAQWSSGAFGLILVVVSGALLFRAPHVLPWDLAPDTSSVFGWTFLGASMYFLYGVARPLWVFAAGPLWGFLAYDALLWIPYFQLIGKDSNSSSGGGMYGSTSSGNGVNEGSLVVYLFVLGFSTLLGLYLFFIHPATRIRFKRTTTFATRPSAVGQMNAS